MTKTSQHESNEAQDVAVSFLKLILKHASAGADNAVIAAGFALGLKYYDDAFHFNAMVYGGALLAVIEERGLHFKDKVAAPASVILPDVVINAEGPNDIGADIPAETVRERAAAVQRSIDEMTSAGGAAGPAAPPVRKESLHGDAGAIPADAVATLEAALEEIATSQHQAYTARPFISEHDSGYRMGVADGHRFCARVARETLAQFQAWRAGGGSLGSRAEADDGG